eukprot:1616346-Rhodomonas_salina.1
MHTGVVNELAHIARVNVFPKDVCYVALERRRCVSQSKLHDAKLELTEGHCKCGFVAVSLCNGDLPVSPKQ